MVPMTQPIDIRRSGRIALLVLNAPPVNALSAQVRAALFDALEAVGRDPEVSGVVIAGEGRCFCAGADVSEFQGGNAHGISAGRDPAELTALMDAFAKPVVAALHGAVLGGGLELALGCHYRVAAPETRLGLPEISLGVLPGAGGTQRLPRLVGPARAAEMILTGDAVNAAAALEMGLIDGVIDADLIAGAIRYVESVVDGDKPLPRARDRQIDASDIPADFFERARTSVKSRNVPKQTIARIVDCVEAAVRLPFDAGIKFEREQFEACNASLEAAALQHGFFARRKAATIPGLSIASTTRRIEQVAVIGGGTMGRGIALSFAGAGFPVTLVETTTDRADAALEAIRVECERMAKSGRLSVEQAGKVVALITPKIALADLASCDLVVEAVFEDLALKRTLAAQLGALCKPDAIIASNTSTLDVDILARASGRPADFVGMHFFSPAHIMRLLEVVRGEATAPDVLATVLAVARKLGKDPVVSGVCYGFIGNRMLEPYLRETEALLLEGATPSQIDGALEAFGMAMGPCRMMDLAGVDVVAKVVIERGKEGGLPDDPRYRIVCRALNDVGRHGQKSSAGFYRYDGRKAVDDGEAVRIIAELASEQGVSRRNRIEDAEIVERCLLPLINEGFCIIGEGIAYRESDIDVVWLSGYGFPALRGGPMFYAHTVGTSWVRQRLLDYGRALGNAFGYWTPAASLPGLGPRPSPKLNDTGMKP
ncbi:MAG TPA: 3-hydroxyacyl-CoA dehydrogenase NAD-binding domain-containing protein [Rhizomicrobium sp.]|nr:3-hydroxyacyl-CoA dehydrogenase NAD-binding domain-containing protein [Rhizomicrobium sp.]